MSIKIKKEYAGTYTTEEFSFESRKYCYHTGKLENSKVETVSVRISLDNECNYFGTGSAWFMSLVEFRDLGFFQDDDNTMFRTLKESKVMISNMISNGIEYHGFHWSVAQNKTLVAK